MIYLRHVSSLKFALSQQLKCVCNSRLFVLVSGQQVIMSMGRSIASRS